jgi:hypothetical protein
LPTSKPARIAVDTSRSAANVSSSMRSPRAKRCDAGIVVFMSMPAQKTRSPAPVSTAQRMPSSSRTRRHASASARIVGGSSAFACSGRSIVTTATCGWSAGSSRRTATG